MKKLSLVLISILSLFVLASCDKGELGPVANSTDATPPALNSPESGSSYTLSRDVPDTTTAMTIEWSKPDFGFSAAATYTVELDESGNEFGDASEIASVQSTSIDVSVGDLNKMLLAKQLAGGQ